jgi:hypothetical protein
VYTVPGVSQNSAFGALAGAFWRRGNDVERIDGEVVWGDTKPSLSNLDASKLEGCVHLV